MRDDQLGEIHMQELDGGMNRKRIVPTFTCGHCSQVVVLNPARKRERKRCGHCGRLICDQNELCRIDCTPIHALAKAHDLEGASKWSRLAPAILAGCSTLEEARQRGFNV